MATNTPQKHLWAIKNAVAFIGVILLIGLIFFLIRPIAQIFFLIFAAILFAIFLQGIADFFYIKTKLPYRIGLILVIVFITLALASLSFIAGPQVVEQAAQLGESIPDATTTIMEWLRQYPWGREIISRIDFSNGFALDINIIGNISSAFSAVMGLFGNIFFILLVGIFIAFDTGIYKNSILLLLPNSKRNTYRELSNLIGRALQRWLIGRFASMAVVGVLTFIGLLIIGMPLALVLGLIAAIFSFIPFLGPLFSVVPAILVAINQSPAMVIYVTLVYGIVQVLESNIITPLIQQYVVSIPPALLVTVQILMGVVAGLIGIFLSTPITVMIIVIIQYVYIQNTLGERVTFLGQH